MTRPKSLARQTSEAYVLWAVPEYHSLRDAFDRWEATRPPRNYQTRVIRRSRDDAFIARGHAGYARQQAAIKMMKLEKLIRSEQEERGLNPPPDPDPVG